MAYIQKVEGKKLPPGSDNPFFTQNKPEWKKLKDGYPVEIPDEEVEFHARYFGGSIEMVLEDFPTNPDYMEEENDPEYEGDK